MSIYERNVNKRNKIQNLRCESLTQRKRKQFIVNGCGPNIGRLSFWLRAIIIACLDPVNDRDLCVVSGKPYRKPFLTI